MRSGRTMALELNVARLQGLLQGQSPKNDFRASSNICADPKMQRPFWPNTLFWHANLASASTFG